MPRTSAAKVLVGPVSHAIEDIVYSHVPEFIKHVPVDLRPRHMMEYFKQLSFDVDHYIASDHTAFESHFHPDMLRICEFALFDWVCRNNTVARSVVSIMKDLMTQTNFLWCPDLCAEVPGRRMSGEMTTSL